eukprot:8150090-Alexandrium_andersonii.AAC.1
MGPRSSRFERLRRCCSTDGGLRIAPWAPCDVKMPADRGFRRPARSDRAAEFHLRDLLRYPNSALASSGRQ